MSHGTQDWHSAIDVVLQSLDEIIQRPKFGIVAPAVYAAAVTASSRTTLVNISGIGNIYWGSIGVTASADQSADYFIFTIDGEAITSATFRRAVDYGTSSPRLPGVFTDCLDNVNFYYSAALGSSITFETSVQIEYVETQGNTPVVTSRLVYALI